MLELSSLDDDDDDELLCCGRPVTFGSGAAGVLAVVDVAMAQRLGSSQLGANATKHPPWPRLTSGSADRVCHSAVALHVQTSSAINPHAGPYASDKRARSTLIGAG